MLVFTMTFGAYIIQSEFVFLTPGMDRILMQMFFSKASEATTILLDKETTFNLLLPAEHNTCKNLQLLPEYVPQTKSKL